MRRRSRASGEPLKAQRRKTGARKSRIAPKAVRPRNSSVVREKIRAARLTRELKEARNRERATTRSLAQSADPSSNCSRFYRALWTPRRSYVARTCL